MVEGREMATQKTENGIEKEGFGEKSKVAM